MVSTVTTCHWDMKARQGTWLPIYECLEPSLPDTRTLRSYDTSCSSAAGASPPSLTACCWSHSSECHTTSSAQPRCFQAQKLYWSYRCLNTTIRRPMQNESMKIGPLQDAMARCDQVKTYQLYQDHPPCRPFQTCLAAQSSILDTAPALDILVARSDQSCRSRLVRRTD